VCHLDSELDAPGQPVRERKHFPSRVLSDPEQLVVTHPLADQALVRGYSLAAVNLLLSRLLSASTDQLVMRKQPRYVGSFTALSKSQCKHWVCGNFVRVGAVQLPCSELLEAVSRCIDLTLVYTSAWFVSYMVLLVSSDGRLQCKRDVLN